MGKTNPQSPRTDRSLSLSCEWNQLFGNPDVDLVKLVLDGGNRLLGRQFHHQIFVEDLYPIFPILRQLLKLLAQCREFVRWDLVPLQDVDVAVRIHELIHGLTRLPYKALELGGVEDRIF